MRIGIYGGSFNPPHLGHMEAARAALEALELDKLLLIPAKTPPHKVMAEGSATPEQRLEMTRLMADGLLQPERVEADDLELKREGLSYTSDTLRQLRERYPQDELWLLVGTDMFLSLQSWHEPQVILSLAGIAAFARKEADRGEVLERQRAYLTGTFGARVEILSLPRIYEISSTQVRRDRDGTGLWGPVWGYILRHGIYGVQADLKGLSADDLRACSLSMVYARRHAHILGVEEEAVRLARRWGADETDARRAGILHDCTKYWTREEHLALCDKYGLELDELERANEKLLHSKTGSLVARYEFGEREEVCQAILWHTTGRPGMSLLEKIVYIADYMEPSRAFDGVEKLREMAYEDLDAAVALGLSMSIEDLRRRGAVIHRDTQGALDWLTEGRKGNEEF